MSLNEQNLPYAHGLVASILREGHENAISTNEIIRLLGWQSKDKRNVMQIAQELVVKYGLPVGASRRKPCGYYYIVSEDELEDTLHPFNAQIRSMSVRKAVLIRNFAAKNQEHFDL